MKQECRKCKKNKRAGKESKSKCTECNGKNNAFELIDDLIPVKDLIESESREENDDFTFFINTVDFKEGSDAFAYAWTLKTLFTVEVVKIVKRSNGIDAYEALVNSDFLLTKVEAECGADTSAEFVLDGDRWLVWFREVEEV